MFPRWQRPILPLETNFSDAYLIGQLANWVIDQIFEIVLGHRIVLNWLETRRNEVFRPKFYFEKRAQESRFSAENKLSWAHFC